MFRIVLELLVVGLGLGIIVFLTDLVLSKQRRHINTIVARFSLSALLWVVLSVVLVPYFRGPEGANGWTLIQHIARGFVEIGILITLLLPLWVTSLVSSLSFLRNYRPGWLRRALIISVLPLMVLVWLVASFEGCMLVGACT